MNSIRVVLADDHPLIMTGFAMALSGYGVVVVGETRTPEEAVGKFEELRPDVLILDIRFGEQLTGFDAAEQILKKFPDAKIVFLSQFDQDYLIMKAYKIGALAFITKGSDSERLAEAIKSACKGETYLLPEVAVRFANQAIRGDASPLSLLDAREIEIFTLMAQGLTNAEIADKLELSLKTISNSSQMVKEKLGISRSAEITKLALSHGFIEP